MTPTITTSYAHGARPGDTISITKAEPDRRWWRRLLYAFIGWRVQVGPFRIRQVPPMRMVTRKYTIYSSSTNSVEIRA